MRWPIAGGGHRGTAYELPPDVPDGREAEEIERRAMVASAGRSSAGRAAPGDRDAVRGAAKHSRDRRRRSTDRRAPSSSCSCGPSRPCASTWRAAMADEALVDRLDHTIDAVLARRDATAALTDPELAPLAVLAAQLRHAPSPAFRARLLANLTRRTTMTTLVLEPTKIREGFTTVTPYVRVREAGLLDFLTAVFDATETFSIKGSSGGVHREVRVGDSMLMIGEGGVEVGLPVLTGGVSCLRAGRRCGVPASDCGGRYVAGRSRGSAVWRTRGFRQGRVRQPLVHRHGLRRLLRA